MPRFLSIFSLFLFILVIHHSECLASQITPDDINTVLVSDIDHEALLNRVSKQLKIKYLSKFEGQIKNKYFGTIWGANLRVLVNLPVRLSYKNCPTLINIIFKIDTGSPTTALTREAIQQLFRNCPQVEQTYRQHYIVEIAGKTIMAIESKAHSQTLNILGGNFMQLFNVHLSIFYRHLQKGSVQIQLDNIVDLENEEL